MQVKERISSQDTICGETSKQAVHLSTAQQADEELTPHSHPLWSLLRCNSCPQCPASLPRLHSQRTANPAPVRSCDSAAHSQRVQAVQQERIKVLSQKLRERLEQHVRGDRASFLQHFRQEAEELSHATFGYEMLHVIGWGACPIR